jgi:hypothetical protein
MIALEPMRFVRSLTIGQGRIPLVPPDDDGDGRLCERAMRTKAAGESAPARAPGGVGSLSRFADRPGGVASDGVRTMLLIGLNEMI